MAVYRKAIPTSWAVVVKSLGQSETCWNFVF